MNTKPSKHGIDFVDIVAISKAQVCTNLKKIKIIYGNAEIDFPHVNLKFHTFDRIFLELRKPR